LAGMLSPLSPRQLAAISGPNHDDGVISNISCDIAALLSFEALTR
jgi:hypothetical protein